MELFFRIGIMKFCTAYPMPKEAAMSTNKWWAGGTVLTTSGFFEYYEGAVANTQTKNIQYPMILMIP